MSWDELVTNTSELDLREVVTGNNGLRTWTNYITSVYIYLREDIREVLDDLYLHVERSTDRRLTDRRYRKELIELYWKSYKVKSTKRQFYLIANYHLQCLQVSSKVEELTILSPPSRTISEPGLFESDTENPPDPNHLFSDSDSDSDSATDKPTDPQDFLFDSDSDSDTESPPDPKFCFSDSDSDSDTDIPFDPNHVFSDSDSDSDSDPVLPENTSSLPTLVLFVPDL